MARIAIVAAALAAASLPAQDATTQAAQRQAGQRLQKALAAMRALPSCAFSTSLSWDAGKGIQGAQQGNVQILMVGGAAIAQGVEKKVSGVWSGDLIQADIGDDNHVVLAGRRQIAREGENPWCLRNGKLANGAPLPHVLDPELLFDRLAALEPEVVHAEVGTWNDRPIEILTVTLEGEDALELDWGGMLPDNGSSRANPFAALLAAQGKKVQLPKPDNTVDMAFFVDPATQLVHEIKVRSYVEGPQLGGRVLVAQGPGGAVQIGGARKDREAEEEEEEPEEEAGAAPKFENGLPVRKTDQTVQNYDIVFSDHGKASAPVLDEVAKKLLGLQ